MSLGIDACAEHEIGIKKMLEIFGCKTDRTGVAKRKIHKHPVAWLQNEKFGGFTSGRIEDWDGKPITIDYLLKHFVEYTESHTLFAGSKKERTYGGGLQCAWDDEEFAAFADNPEDIARLKQIYDAFMKDDIILFMTGGGWMGNGMAIGIASRMPKEITDKWEVFDQKQIRLKKAVAATDIESYLRKCGKHYFALRGEFTDETEKELTFFLNPMDQYKHNYGWFSLEDLITWGEDKGRVVKEQYRK